MPVTPTVVATGAQAATVGTTKHTLDSGASPHTTDGIFVLRVDVNVLVALDSIEFFVTEEVENSSGTARDQLIGEMAGEQGVDNDWWHSPPFLLANGWDFKLRQPTGTSRTFPWSIWQV